MSEDPDPSAFVPVNGNGFGCDLCGEKRVVGWTRVSLPDRSLGGSRGVKVYMVCIDHLTLGDVVYPRPPRQLETHHHHQP